MKKLTTTILAAAMILSLTACGNNATSSTANDNSEPTTSATTADTSRAEDTSSAVESTPAESTPEDTTASESEVTTSAPEEEVPPAEENEPAAVTKVDYTVDEVCKDTIVWATNQQYSDFYTANDRMNGYNICCLDSDFNKLDEIIMQVINGRIYVYIKDGEGYVAADKDGDIAVVGSAYDVSLDGDIITDGKNKCYYDLDGNKLDMPYYGGFIGGYASNGENGKVSVMDASGNITEYAIDHDFSADRWTYFLGGEYMITYNADTENLITYKTDGTLVSEMNVGDYIKLMNVYLMPLSDGTYYNNGLIRVNLHYDSTKNTYKYINVLTGEYVFGNNLQNEYYTLGSAYAMIDDMAVEYIDAQGSSAAQYYAASPFCNGVALVYDGTSVFLVNEKFEKVSDDIFAGNLNANSSNFGLVSDGKFVFTDEDNYTTHLITINSVE